jgi:DNA-directed RNA polymerase delta subunit
MSMNVTPHIPQVIVNASAPSTEALAKANSVREVVPPVVQTEAAVPQKSREQDRRSPSSSDDVTYGPIQKARGEVVTQIADEQDSDFDGDESARDEDGVVAQSANGESEQTSDIDEESNEGSESEGDVSASQQESDNSAQE